MLSWGGWVILVVSMTVVFAVWLVVLWPRAIPSRFDAPAWPLIAHIVQDGRLWYAECPVSHAIWVGPSRDSEDEANTDAFVHNIMAHPDTLQGDAP